MQASLSVSPNTHLAWMTWLPGCLGDSVVAVGPVLEKRGRHSMDTHATFLLVWPILQIKCGSREWDSKKEMSIGLVAMGGGDLCTYK